jgi:hypothetical protein
MKESITPHTSFLMLDANKNNSKATLESSSITLSKVVKFQLLPSSSSLFIWKNLKHHYNYEKLCPLQLVIATEDTISHSELNNQWSLDWFKT